MVEFKICQLHVHDLYFVKNCLVLEYFVLSFLELVFAKFWKVHLLDLLSCQLVDLLTRHSLNVSAELERSFFGTQPEHALVVKIFFTKGCNFPSWPLVSFWDFFIDFHFVDGILGHGLHNFIHFDGTFPGLPSFFFRAICFFTDFAHKLPFLLHKVLKGFLQSRLLHQISLALFV